MWQFFFLKKKITNTRIQSEKLETGLKAKNRTQGEKKKKKTRNAKKKKKKKKKKNTPSIQTYTHTHTHTQIEININSKGKSEYPKKNQNSKREKKGRFSLFKKLFKQEMIKRTLGRGALVQLPEVAGGDFKSALGTLGTLGGLGQGPRDSPPQGQHNR